MADYLRYWQLSAAPYQGGKTVYPSPSLDEATARIDHLARGGSRTGTLIGDAGTGKSVALAQAASELGRQGFVVVTLDLFAISQREFVAQLATQLAGSPRSADDLPRLWRRVGDALSQLAWQTPGVVLLCDDAGAGTAEVLQSLMRVQHLAASGNCPLCTIVSATTRQATRWPERLSGAVDLRIEMYPWDEFTTVDYLQHAAIDAGRLMPLFTEDAMYALHARSGGIPRQLAKLAELALVTGAAAELPIVDSSVIAHANSELLGLLA